MVHGHNVHHYLSFGSLRVAARIGSPVVLTSHDFLLFCCDRLPCIPRPSDFVPRWTGCAKCQRLRYNPFRRPLIRRIVRSAVTEILAISDLMRNALKLNGFDRVATVHNGIRPDEWPMAGHSARESGNRKLGWTHKTCRKLANQNVIHMALLKIVRRLGNKSIKYVVSTAKIIMNCATL